MEAAISPQPKAVGETFQCNQNTLHNTNTKKSYAIQLNPNKPAAHQAAEQATNSSLKPIEVVGNLKNLAPKPLTVGEASQNTLQNHPNQISKPSYAAQTVGKNSDAKSKKLELSPVTFVKGEPTVEFTIEEVNAFTIEEGLHQAVILKFSYGRPELQELRQNFSKHFDVKGNCNIGQLEYRHILVRFDLFEDFSQVLSRATGYVKSKGDEFFFRSFPWTIGFNPREETSKAVVWISFPELPANFFAKKSLMSIASAVGKPLAVDKATQDRTRPSTARVKVLLDLLDKLPKRIKIHIGDSKSGKMVEYYQQIVYDNVPNFCTICKHQGHGDKSCRWRSEENRTEADRVDVLEGPMKSAIVSDEEKIKPSVKARGRGDAGQNRVMARTATVKMANSNAVAGPIILNNECRGAVGILVTDVSQNRAGEVDVETENSSLEAPSDAKDIKTMVDNNDGKILVGKGASLNKKKRTMDCCNK